MLILLFGESDETIASGHARQRIGHDLSGFAGRESALEERDEDVFVDFRTEIADKDAVLGSSIVPSISQATTRGPVQLERAVGVGDELAVEGKGLGRGIRAREVDEAISSIAAMR